MKIPFSAPGYRAPVNNHRGTRCSNFRRGRIPRGDVSTTLAPLPPRASFPVRQRVIRNGACCIPVSDAISPRAYAACSIQRITNGQLPAGATALPNRMLTRETRDSSPPLSPASSRVTHLFLAISDTRDKESIKLSNDRPANTRKTHKRVSSRSRDLDAVARRYRRFYRSNGMLRRRCFTGAKQRRLRDMDTFLNSD